MFKNLAFILGLFLLQGCSGAVLGGALFGAYFTSSFSTISETTNEYKTQQKIKKELVALKKLQEDIKFEVDVLIQNKIIYVVGVAQNKLSKAYAMDFIYSKYSKNFKIMDEVKLGSSGNQFSDFFIKRKIKTKLIFTNGIRYANYNITVYGGEVTIIGYASSKYESSSVLNVLSSVRGVKKVINYIEIKDLGD